MNKKTAKWAYKFVSVLLTLCLVVAATPITWAAVDSQQNIALGKPATASSYESEARSPAMGNDGNENTMWIANGGASGNWWMVDLQADYLLTGSNIQFESSGVVWKYRIEASIDGEIWAQVVDKSENTSTDATQVDSFSTTARYLRVTVTECPSSSWTAFRELQVFGELPPLDNVALNKAADASSTQGSAQSIALANDGDPLTMWIANSGAAGNWWSVDIGGSYDISAASIEFETDTRVWKYQIQASSDGTDWQTIVDNRDNTLTNKKQSFLFDAMNCQYLRVVFEVAPGSAWTAIAEFQAFGIPTDPSPDEISLVIIPHQDDEAIIAAGVIRQALLDKNDVRVVIATNGDYGAGDQSKGIGRLNESISALSILGLSRSKIIPLGYADTGGFEPWTRYANSFMYRLYHAATEDTVLTGNFDNTSTYGIPNTLEDYHYTSTGSHGSYTRRSLISDLEGVITEYMPAKIYTTSAYDLHGDHAYLNLFVNDALRSVANANPGYRPVFYEAMVHSVEGDSGWPIVDSDPTPIQLHTEPLNLPQTPLLWENRVSIPVPDSMLTVPRTQNMKTRALKAYGSQYSDYIGSFVKADEIFWAKDFANLAYTATCSSSSAAAPARYVADGIIGGFLQLPVREWRAVGVSDEWVRMVWADTQSVSKIVLHDLPESDNNAQEVVLTFSDGTSVTVTDIPAEGKPKVVTFDAKDITWVQATVTQHVGTVVGVAELEVF